MTFILIFLIKNIIISQTENVDISYEAIKHNASADLKWKTDKFHIKIQQKLYRACGFSKFGPCLVFSVQKFPTLIKTMSKGQKTNVFIQLNYNFEKVLSNVIKCV